MSRERGREEMGDLGSWVKVRMRMKREAERKNPKIVARRDEARRGEAVEFLAATATSVTHQQALLPTPSGTLGRLGPLEAAAVSGVRRRCGHPLMEGHRRTAMC